VLGAAAAALIVVAGIAYGLASLPHPPGGPSASGPAAGGPAESPHVNRPSPPIESPAEVEPGSVLHVIDSGTDYQPGTLARQAAAVLDRHAGSNAGQAQQTVTPQVQACVRVITGGRTPRLVDMARYRGRPATIIIQAPATGQPGRVWVAGPACPAQHGDLLAHARLPGPG
jgi:hypothetical protein